MTRRLLLPLLSLSLLSLASELHAESSDSLQRRPVLIRRAVKKQTPAEPLKKEAQQHTPARKDATPSSPSSPSPAPSATTQTPSSTDSVRRTILRDFEQWVRAYCVIIDKADSSVKGAHGNQERFYRLQKSIRR